MNKIFSSLIIFLSLVNYNKAYSAAVTPSSYINTVHSVMLCETGSSENTCLNPVILGSEGTTGKSFDLSSTTAGQSAGGIGSLLTASHEGHGGGQRDCSANGWASQSDATLSHYPDARLSVFERQIWLR